MYNSTLDSPAGSSSNLGLSPESLGFLNETRKWTHFLSILGFIFVGLIAIFSLFIGSFLDTFNSSMGGGLPFPSIIITIVYFAFALLYFVPTIYLFRFSARLKGALVTNDPVLLTEAFGNLKSLFKFWGIFSIIIISIYALFFIFAIVMGVVMR